MLKRTLILTASYGALAIIFGALGAHALKNQLSNIELTNYKTAVFYQLINVLAILAFNAFPSITKQTKIIVSYSLLSGITLFSGSIYLISLHWVSAKSIWFITPLGGLFMIFGWLAMIYAFATVKQTQNL